ncbi:hypothetical protein ERJ75_001334200 [Trypanosoma vivax]|uniref:Endonuclease/exonuclease/phosphatase domain-containing protein n=1 Tax=Trypanosoma vivax (strain Y486) TaxID=1055687 RepID=G0U623_TRYVY|nr:hypothetical protein TRVL_07921 [Trypanosoma vivax]KAH8608161.1 hypothetical protein ERJ75_001334200 [Trypanosoma vivax]CCC51324.1 conserved hypothetical protein, fragment [Trypanosoma vivax Y486]
MSSLFHAPAAVSERDIEAEDKQLLDLQPGGLLHYDYRSAASKALKLPSRLSIVQWNIERGIQFDLIVETLRALQADIIFLQELDINCRRSNYRNVVHDLAKALEVEVYFVCEFEELDAADRAPQHAVGPLSKPTRGAKDQAGTCQQNNGDRRFHGNAILSASGHLSNPVVIPHHVCFDWEKRGCKIQEPRHGFRCALRCQICPSERVDPRLPELYLYCCHLEIFCGVLGRVRQLTDILRDANGLLEEHQATRKARPALVIGGDLNTVAHGIVRLAWGIGNDRMRFLSLGEAEACWLQRKVLSRHLRGFKSLTSPFPLKSIPHMIRTVYSSVCSSDFVFQFLYGFSTEELRAMDNSRLCFYDPSDKALSVTLDNPKFCGLVKGKLDWLLLSNLRAVPPVLPSEAVAALEKCESIGDPTAAHLLRKDVAPDGYVLFNTYYTASDHKGILLHAVQDVDSQEDAYPKYGATYTSSWTSVTTFMLSRLLLWFLLFAVFLAITVMGKNRGHARFQFKFTEHLSDRER